MRDRVTYLVQENLSFDEFIEKLQELKREDTYIEWDVCKHSNSTIIGIVYLQDEEVEATYREYKNEDL